ncbi:NADH dehydrogenase [Anoxybacter fermentans]|uniref:NADH:ubiquinone reductase (non-electrogenic) n=1 Tax=Anoxybacter fermentans TaxID=1323375 RepID=A0A3Q9HPG7_9FIRM|nr:NAD(P)/FAD-dependent oxidoreductase [Anoxybacter fermentans]AZR72600.1 NADH dehydrogenase [Anoxybacter fermentans]
MNKLKEIVILGAGYAGVTAAKTLHKKLCKDPTVRVRLISQSPFHVLLTQLHEVAGNRIRPSDVQISLKDVFEGTKIEVVEDQIKSIDFEKQILKGSNGQYNYDYLIIGTGSEPTYYGIPGMKEHSLTLWSLEDAKKIKAHIRSMFIAASQEVDPKKREAMLTFVVGGGGFTGIEMIGELAEWVRDLCQIYNVDRDDVRLIVVEALPNILPVLKKKGLVDRAIEYLTNTLNVEIKTNSPICEVHPEHIVLENETIPTRTLIWTGGVKANNFVKNLGLPLNKRDRIEVNEYCQTCYENVYAVGDNSFFIDEKGMVLPALVEAAMQTAKTAAKNIVADLKGQEKKPLKPKLHGVMVSIGGNYAVADIMGIPMWGFVAMMMKHLVDMHYLWEVNGFKLVWEYIAHEFSEIKGGIGVLVRHMSKKINAFWLILLRIIIGLRFLTEGIHKIQDGWFGEWEKLASGASSVLWGEGTPQWYVSLMKTFVVPHQIFLQKVIVITEIGLGLLLIFGLFTVLAALGTMAMSASFIMAAWGGPIWDPLMLFVGSFALLGGAGRAFGLDYYVLPWLFSLSKKPVSYPKHITFEQ